MKELSTWSRSIFWAFMTIPESSSLSIRTSGLLGEQFLALNLGFYDEALDSTLLKDGGRITNTNSAMVLEDLLSIPL